MKDKGRKRGVTMIQWRGAFAVFCSTGELPSLSQCFHPNHDTGKQERTQNKALKLIIFVITS